MRGTLRPPRRKRFLGRPDESGVSRTPRCVFIALGQRSRGRPISSARAVLARAMGCLASRPRVDDPADTSRAFPSDPNARASPSASVRPGTAPAATHRRRGARNLRVRVPGDDDDGESSGGDDPDAVRAIVMVQSPDIVSNAAASTMRLSRGRSSLYESTSRAVAGPREETRASRVGSSSSSSSAAARSLPGSVGSRCGGGEGSTTPDAIELERATREVREACAAVAATCAATATTSSSLYSSSGSSLAGSSYSTGSSIRDDSRAPYRRDLAAVESDVIAAVARLRRGAGSAEERAPVEVALKNRSKKSQTLSVGVENPSPSDAVVGQSSDNRAQPRRHPRSIARVGTLPTSARRAAAAELVRKAMRRYEASGRRAGAAGPAGPAGGDERGGGGVAQRGGGGIGGARPGAPRRVTPIQF